MIINDDKAKLKECILEKLEEVQKVIYEYIDECGWHDMNDDVCVPLGGRSRHPRTQSLAL